MNLVARARHVLARRPWLYWSAVARARRRRPAGPSPPAAPASTTPAGRGATTRDVVVATADIAPGDPLAGAHRDAAPDRSPVVPADAARRGARRRDGPPARRRRRGRSSTPTSRRPPAPQALIPAGWSAVAVAEAVPTGARIGDARDAPSAAASCWPPTASSSGAPPTPCSSPCPPTTRRPSPTAADGRGRWRCCSCRDGVSASRRRRR